MAGVPGLGCPSVCQGDRDRAAIVSTVAGSERRICRILCIQSLASPGLPAVQTASERMKYMVVLHLGVFGRYDQLSMTTIGLFGRFNSLYRLTCAS